ncbi:MAG TPA: hypothetical protein VI749_00940 [Candidatus Omnitrophota bacterium]|nr:hypothetical protein [Candidatus Omnitrophota bacterium]
MIQIEGQAPQRHLLGEILIQRRLITPGQLQRALEVQKNEKRYLGEILIDLGIVEERDILVALVVQCNLPYIAVHNYSIDQNVISLIPVEMARRYHVMPLDRVGDILSVVMADPLNEEIKTELIKATQCQIAPFIATKAEIEEAISRWYKS